MVFNSNTPNNEATNNFNIIGSIKPEFEVSGHYLGRKQVGFD